MDALAASLAVLGVIAFVGILAWDRRRTARALSRWTHTGLPPPEGFEVAAEVLREQTGIRGGSIEWVPGPITVPGGTAGGRTLNRGAHLLELQWAARIEDTAFAHECCVMWWGRDGDEDPGFQAWVFERNREIARRLGRGA